MGQPFISSDDLADYTEYTLSAPKALIAVDAACEMLRALAEQEWDYTEDDVVVLDNMEGRDTLMLPEIPVWEVSKVEGPGGVVLVEGTDYVVDLEIGAVCTARKNSRFLTGRRLYTVTYTHGFADSITGGMPANAQLWPADLRMLALTLAMRIYDQQITRQESVGGAQTVFSQPESLGVSRREQAVLLKYGAGRRRG